MNWLKKIFCKIGWHSFSYDLVEKPNDPLHTGICDRYKCKWCGMISLVDSQGNLFDPKKYDLGSDKE